MAQYSVVERVPGVNGVAPALQDAARVLTGRGGVRFVASAALPVRPYEPVPAPGPQKGHWA